MTSIEESLNEEPRWWYKFPQPSTSSVSWFRLISSEHESFGFCFCGSFGRGQCDAFEFKWEIRERRGECNSKQNHSTAESSAGSTWEISKFSVSGEVWLGGRSIRWDECGSATLHLIWVAIAGNDIQNEIGNNNGNNGHNGNIVVQVFNGPCDEERVRMTTEADTTTTWSPTGTVPPILTTDPSPDVTTHEPITWLWKN